MKRGWLAALAFVTLPLSTSAEVSVSVDSVSDALWDRVTTSIMAGVENHGQSVVRYKKYINVLLANQDQFLADPVSLLERIASDPNIVISASSGSGGGGGGGGGGQGQCQSQCKEVCNEQTKEVCQTVIEEHKECHKEGDKEVCKTITKEITKCVSETVKVCQEQCQEVCN